ncbi:MAG: CoA-binding protein [Planctomycetota bacterium]|jgi:predicted CoA-binding protein|nr:CoA-binding protein [Planctomycetota bacterium]
MNVAILGASRNLERYSNKAQLRLMEEGHTVFPVSKKDELIAGVKAYPNLAAIFEKIDTLTIYVRPAILEDMIEEVIDLSPRRVIFNPGTEDVDVQKAVAKAGIEVQVSCTLVLLNTKQFEDKKESV